LTDAQNLKKIRDLINRKIGIFYPDNRLETLSKRLKKAAQDNVLEESQYLNLLANQIWSEKIILELVKYLTIPETYFFRDRAVFDALEDVILPELASLVSNEQRTIYIWSTACSTGEEPYSLAILLHGLMSPDQLKKVRIIGTDINDEYLSRARTGIYSVWSLRTTPDKVVEKYFAEISEGKFQISDVIREMVSFSNVNLVDVKGAFLEKSVDLLLCRNALIYFSNEQARNTLDKLALILRPGGWCLLAAAEGALAPEKYFERKRFPSAVIFKKKFLPGDKSIDEAPKANYSPKLNSNISTPPQSPPTSQQNHDTLEQAYELAKSGQYTAAFELVMPIIDGGGGRDAQTMRLVSEYHLRQGNLQEAIVFIDDAIQLEPLHHSMYYWKAMLFYEANDLVASIDLLKQALFLEPKFILAEFMLENFLKRLGRESEAVVHLANLKLLLNAMSEDTILPESDGMSAGQLKKLIDARG